MRVWFGFLVWVATGFALLACNDKPKAPDESASRRAEGAPVASSVGGVWAHSAAASNGVPPIAAMGPRQAALLLRVATWNVEWLNAQDGAGPVARQADDYARLARYAKRLNADVVALQEVDGPEAAARVFDPQQYAFYFTAGNSSQRTGFAYKRTLQVTPHADFGELDLGRLRSAADISVHLQRTSAGVVPLRLLSVHLKSGCFDGPLSNEKKSCAKLSEQLPILEAWIDARASEGTPFAVLGDFNRRLFARPDDPFWREIDDAQPPLSDLDSPTRGQLAQCWGQRHPHFIDHLVLGKTVDDWVRPNSFAQLVYDASDQRFEKWLSDHCALSIELAPTRAELDALRRALPSDVVSAPVSVEANGEDSSSDRKDADHVGGGPIKGNVGRRGAKLYHHVGCPNYDRVQIDAAKGERLFANEAAARSAGWVLSPDCN